jgi:hypothetical protein
MIEMLYGPTEFRSIVVKPFHIEEIEEKDNLEVHTDPIGDLEPCTNQVLSLP